MYIRIEKANKSKPNVSYIQLENRIQLSQEMVVGNGCWLFGFLFEISFRCERELNAKTARGEDKPDGSITTTLLL